MRYLILGASEALDEHGEAVPLGGTRLRALFAALALHADSSSPVPVEVLINDVWADADGGLPDDATAALQALVGRLRRAIGRDAVESLPGGYRLRAGPEDIDLHCFQRLAREGESALDAGDAAAAARLFRDALALWRGPALADLPDRGAAAARPEAQRTRVQQRRIAADLALGRAAQVLPELHQLAAGQPLDEPLHALLIRALRDAGRQAEALAAYEAVRREIAARLGVDPGPELRVLHAELLAADGDGAGGGHEPGEGGGLGVSGNGAVGGRGGAGADRGPSLAGARSTPGNLRTRLTSFVGRESDLDTLRADLARSRLVTLTGPGGSGKTRLSEEAAAFGAGGSGSPYAGSPYADLRSADSHHAGSPYPDGAWLVELAPLDHPSAVPGAVLSALGRRSTALRTGTIESGPAVGRTGATGTLAGVGGAPEPASDAMARLLEHCAQRRLLIVLDNCEHVIDAAAHLAETLLAHSPGLTVLATSREPLGVPGETVRPVEPLPPEPAHRLFADRAAAARAGFDMGSDPEAVAEICRRLDGLPLAIELAAARLRSLTPRQIADRLDDRFRLLTSGSRTVLPRQQTLRAVVDWSWDLLDERERTVLRRLSVFSGGCTLTAAEYVCADLPGVGASGSRDGEWTDGAGLGHERDGARLVDEGDVLDVLGTLVDKSILIAEQPQQQPEPPPQQEPEQDRLKGPHGDVRLAQPGTARPASAQHGSGVRYRMLETIQEYANERAAAHPADLASAETRHTEQLLRFVTAAEPRLRSDAQLTWLSRLEADLDNVRAALHRTLQHANTADTADTAEKVKETATSAVFAFVRAMGWFWWLRNYRDEGARWIQRALDLLPGDSAERDEDTELLYREFQLLRYFLLSEQEPNDTFKDESHRRDLLGLLDFFRRPRPESARMPGLLWPFTAFVQTGSKGVADLMDVSVDTCRRYGQAWELAVSLLFRAHIRVDVAGGLSLAYDDMAEIEALARSTGDRWLLSQVSGLRAEFDVQHGRYEEAIKEYEAARRYAQQLCAITELPFLNCRIADIRYRQGDSEEAESLARLAGEDAARLGIADARAFACCIRSLITLESGDPVLARKLHRETESYAALGTPPVIFEVALSALGARISAAEGRAMPDAVREVRGALRRGVDVGAPEALLAHVLLAAASVTLAGGHPRTALRLVDAAGRQRGELTAGVPESRMEDFVRAHAAAEIEEPGSTPEQTDTGATPSSLSSPSPSPLPWAQASSGEPVGAEPPTVDEACALLDALLDG
ncbi:AfsR/SARP family transcriptional regulator [Streptomyces albidus (ex Kaewkla and Franco 2022)]|uniref:AfsR/SARP family transcriptional regulator n=1 Tax=Streptomyces albidus (ex Kaewkla and Franco 2022) TaxID=722709 RepID=UPI0015EEBF5D|nr:BTAD domain-containing putative transcriptional regulator [Streptomyces albidus (ex Kaewkla and Franco 2022)]